MSNEVSDKIKAEYEAEQREKQRLESERQAEIEKVKQETKEKLEAEAKAKEEAEKKAAEEKAKQERLDSLEKQYKEDMEAMKAKIDKLSGSKAVIGDNDNDSSVKKSVNDMSDDEIMKLEQRSAEAFFGTKDWANGLK